MSVQADIWLYFEHMADSSPFSQNVLITSLSSLDGSLSLIIFVCVVETLSLVHQISLAISTDKF